MTKKTINGQVFWLTRHKTPANACKSWGNISDTVSIWNINDEPTLHKDTGQYITKKGDIMGIRIDMFEKMFGFKPKKGLKAKFQLNQII